MAYENSIKCIGSVIDIGCYGNCNAIEFPYEATQTGVHVLLFSFYGQKNSVNFEAVAGDKMLIPNVFNDDGKTTFRIEQPDGEYFSKIVNNEEYKYFRVDISSSNNETPTVFAGTTDNPFTDTDKAKLDSLENTDLNQSITIGGNLTTQGYHTFTQTFATNGATVPTRTIFVGFDGNLYYKSLFGSTTQIN